MNKITQSNKSVNGTSLKGYLLGPSYIDLVRTLGEPNRPDPSGDDKVQKEWVLDFNGEVYTIYDWKTYDAEYTMNELIRWHIGSKAPVDNFAEELMDMIYHKTGLEASYLTPSQEYPTAYSAKEKVSR
jgi:hypothetical protein